MMMYVNRAMQACWHWLNSLSTGEWLILLSAVMAMGFLCLRGFGSRANY